MVSHYQQARAKQMLAALEKDSALALETRELARSIGTLWPRPWRADIRPRDVPPQHRDTFKRILRLFRRDRLAHAEWHVLLNGRAPSFVQRMPGEPPHSWWRGRHPRPGGQAVTVADKVRAWFAANVDPPKTNGPSPRRERAARTNDHKRSAAHDTRKRDTRRAH